MGTPLPNIFMFMSYKCCDCFKKYKLQLLFGKTKHGTLSHKVIADVFAFEQSSLCVVI